MWDSSLHKFTIQPLAKTQDLNRLGKYTLVSAVEENELRMGRKEWPPRGVRLPGLGIGQLPIAKLG